jgi:hypothetical protein
MQMAAARLLGLPKLPTNLQDLKVDMENEIINDLPKVVAPSSPITDVIPLADPEVPPTATAVLLQGLATLQSALQHQQLALDCTKRAMANL